MAKGVAKGGVKGVAEDAVAASAWSAKPRSGGPILEGAEYVWRVLSA